MPRSTLPLIIFLTFTGLTFALPVAADSLDDLAEANDWFTFGEFDKALNRTNNLIDGNLLNGKELRDAYILQARCLVALDRDEEAEKSFRHVIGIDPQWQPDPVLFTPEETASYSAAVTTVLAGSATNGDKPTPTDEKDPSARLSGFFIGAGASALMMNGSGSIGSIDFDVTNQLLNELQIDSVGFTEIGWGLASKTLFGFKPLVGYRINSQFSLFGCYQFFLNKSSESNHFSDISGDFENVDGDWSQNSFQFFLQFYLTPHSGFYLLGGLGIVSATASYQTVWDWGGGEAGSYSEDFNLSGAGPVLGVGMDFGSNPNDFNFYGSVSYSLVQTNDPLFGLDSEIKVGGFVLEAGVRKYFTK